MRDAIGPDEEGKLVRALRSGLPWEEVREILPGVDPAALDRGFKDRIHMLAGLGPPSPAPELELAPVLEVEAPRFKRGKK